MDAISIGQIIVSHRKISGLTQAELAKLAGVGKTVVFDIEHGKESLRFDKLQKILSALNIKLELSSPIMIEVQSELKNSRNRSK